MPYPTYTLREALRRTYFGHITEVDLRHIFEQFCSSEVCPAHAFSTHIRRLFRAFWRSLTWETAVAAY